MAAAPDTSAVAHVFLFDCLVPTSLLASAAEATEQLLTTLEGVFGRIADHAESERVRRINRDSRTWSTQVAPLTYPTRLAAWGGFRAGEDDAATGTELGNHLVNTLDTITAEARRLEVNMMRTHWRRDTAVPTIEAERRCQQLLRELTSVVWAADAKEWVRVRRLVYLARLRAAATAEVPPCTAEASARTEAAQQLLLTALDASLAAFEPDTPIGRSLATLLTFLNTGTPMPFITLTECLVLAEAERTTSGSPASAAGAAPTARRARHEAVARRHSEQQRREAERAYREATGDGYRRLSAEEQRVGVSLALDIAAYMEQVALLAGETVSLVNTPRMAAKELLEKFKQDGDLVSLHDLAEEWEARVEEAKRAAGKVAVYL